MFVVAALPAEVCAERTAANRARDRNQADSAQLGHRAQRNALHAGALLLG
jgi:hypothetical protein